MAAGIIGSALGLSVSGVADCHPGSETTMRLGIGHPSLYAAVGSIQPGLNDNYTISFDPY